MTLESPLDSTGNKPVNPKGNQPWIFIGRTDTEAEAPIIWPPDAKSQLTGKTLMRGRIEGQRKRGGDRGWDGLMASLTQWTWVWASSGRQWRTGKPVMLQSIGAQRVGHDLVTEQQLPLLLLLQLLLQLPDFPPSLQGRRPRFDSWVGKIHWRKDRLPTPLFLGFPCGSAGKESACNVGDLGSIPELGRSPGEGKVYPFQYSGLEHSMTV